MLRSDGSACHRDASLKNLRVSVRITDMCYENRNGLQSAKRGGILEGYQTGSLRSAVAATMAQEDFRVILYANPFSRLDDAAAEIHYSTVVGQLRSRSKSSDNHDEYHSSWGECQSIGQQRPTTRTAIAQNTILFRSPLSKPRFSSLAMHRPVDMGSPYM